MLCCYAVMLLWLSVPILKQLTIAPEVVDSFTALVAAFLIKLTPDLMFTSA